MPDPLERDPETRVGDVVERRAKTSGGPRLRRTVSPISPSTASTPTASTPTASMAAAQAWSRLTDIARAAIRTQASVAKQSVDLSWATLAGNLDRTSASKAYLESITRESARCWREVGKLGMDCAADLVELGKCVSATILKEVAAAARKSSTPYASGAHGHEADGRRGVEVSLSGPIGGRAEGRIMVVNRHPRPRRIQLSAGNLVDSFGAVVGAVMDISPATVTVPSGEERAVTLGVDLDEAWFSAVHEYSCTVEVSGGDEARIEVLIKVAD